MTLFITKNKYILIVWQTPTQPVAWLSRETCLVSIDNSWYEFSYSQKRFVNISVSICTAGARFARVILPDGRTGYINVFGYTFKELADI